MICMDGAITYTGIWELEDDRLKIKTEKCNFKEKMSSKKWVTHTLILLSDDELHTQVKGQDALVHKRFTE